jgi:hypothetical protein
VRFYTITVFIEGFPEGFRLSITDVHPSSTLEGLVSPRALDCQLLKSIRRQPWKGWVSPRALDCQLLMSIRRQPWKGWFPEGFSLSITDFHPSSDSRNRVIIPNKQNRTAMKALFLYLNLCPSAMFNSHVHLHPYPFLLKDREVLIFVWYTNNGLLVSNEVERNDININF